MRRERSLLVDGVITATVASILMALVVTGCMEGNPLKIIIALLVYGTYPVVLMGIDKLVNTIKR